MKLTLIISLFAASTVFAHSTYYHHSHSHYYGHGHHYGHHDSVHVNLDGDAAAVVAAAGVGLVGGAMLASCSPEQSESNVQATDKLLVKLINSEEFKNEARFVEIAANIVVLKDIEKKINALYAMVDVKTPTEAAFFVGARKEELKEYAVKLAQNTDLPLGKAEKVAEKLITGLKSGF